MVLERAGAREQHAFGGSASVQSAWVAGEDEVGLDAPQMRLEVLLVDEHSEQRRVGVYVGLLEEVVESAAKRASRHQPQSSPRCQRSAAAPFVLEVDHAVAESGQPAIAVGVDTALANDVQVLAGQ